MNKNEPETENKQLELTDLGDASIETKQGDPMKPYFVDSIYGFGSRPNW